MTLKVAPLRCSRCLVVALRDVPDLPPRALRRVLPGLLDAQVPLDLSTCVHAFAGNAGGVVALLARNEDVAAEVAARPGGDAAPDSLAPLPWALWREALAELPPASDSEQRVVLGADPDGMAVSAGRGAAYVASAGTGADAASVARALRLAFGPGTGAVRCLCVGPAAESLARELAETGLVLAPESLGDPSTFLERALKRARRESATLDTVSATARRARWATTCCAAAGVGLLALSVGLLCLSNRATSGAREAGAALDRELSIRVDSLVGYHVTARGSRAVEIARKAAADRDPAVPEWFRVPGASILLERGLSAAHRTDGVSLFSIRVSEDELVASGNVSEPGVARAYAKALEEGGLTVALDIPAAAPGDALRFTATARRKP